MRVEIPDRPAGRPAEDSRPGGIRLLSVSADRGHESAAGEFMVDLPHDEGVGAVLAALHEISPRVLIGLAQTCDGNLAAS